MKNNNEDDIYELDIDAQDFKKAIDELQQALDAIWHLDAGLNCPVVSKATGDEQGELLVGRKYIDHVYETDRALYEKMKQDLIKNSKLSK